MKILVTGGTGMVGQYLQKLSKSIHHMNGFLSVPNNMI